MHPIEPLPALASSGSFTIRFGLVNEREIHRLEWHDVGEERAIEVSLSNCGQPDGDDDDDNLLVSFIANHQLD